MARRRLEAAIHAGQHLAEGDNRITSYEDVEIRHVHRYDDAKEGVYSLQYSYDGKMMAVGFGDGGIEVINTSTGESEKEIRRHKFGGLPVTCLRFSPVIHDTCFGGTSEGKVVACSVEKATAVDVVSEPGNEINCMDFCLEGGMFATAGKDLDIRLYNTDTCQLVKQYSGYNLLTPDHTLAGHAQRVFALKFHPESNDIFISGGWDNHLKIWDARTHDGVQRTIPGPHICGDGLDVRGFQILTGSWQTSDALQLWDFSGELIQTIPFPDTGEGEFLYCAQFCHNNVVLAGGSGTNSVQAINTSTNKVVGEVKLGRPVQALDSTNGGVQFAVAGIGWQLKMAALV